MPKPAVLKYFKNPAAKALGVYTFTNFFGKGVAFLLLPYFTAVLSREDMGMVTLFSNSLLFLIPFISMGALQSAGVEYFKKDKQQFRDFFTSSMVLPLIVFIVSLLVCWLGSSFLTVTYKFPASFIWLIPVAGFLSFINQIIITLIRNEENKKLFMGVVLGRLFLEIALAVIFISGLQMAWQGRINGIVISYAVFLLYAIYFLIKRQYLSGTVKKAFIKEELLFAIPVVVLQFSTFCMNYSDTFFLSKFTQDNNASVGVYGIACVFASVIITLCSALLQYILPKIYKLLSEPSINYTAIRKWFLRYVAIMTGGLLLLLAAVPLVYKFIINKNYLPGLQYYWLLCIGYYFWTIAYLFFSILLYYKYKRKIIALSFSFAAISLASNYFFIKNMQASGAAIAVFCSYFIILVITLFFTRKQVAFLYQKQTNPHTLS